jgi:hypothetical protein
MVTQALSVRKEPDIYPRPLLVKRLKESVTSSCITDGLLFSKWQIHWKLFHLKKKYEAIRFNTDQQLKKWHMRGLSVHLNGFIVKA